jgi:hypothetical protein
MNRSSCCYQIGGKSSAFLTFIFAFAICLAAELPAQAQFTPVKISNDSFHNSDSQHKTEVEPAFKAGTTSETQVNADIQCGPPALSTGGLRAPGRKELR